MYTLKMKLSGTMRGIPVPTGVITRVFKSKMDLAAYVSRLLTDEENKHVNIESMTVQEGEND